MTGKNAEFGGGEHDPLRLDHQLCFPLYAATNLIQRLYRPLLEPLGLTYTQYLVLLLLWERGSVTVGEVSECLLLDIGTISPLLKRMERAGLVERVRDPHDERRVIVTPTAHAIDLRKKAREIPEKLAAQTGIGIEDGAKMYGLVTGLVDRLKGITIDQGELG